MNTKRIVLFAGLGGTLLIFALFSLESNLCYINAFCMKIRNFFSNDIFMLIFLTPPLLFLSLITYFMRDEVFRAWWSFARWWVPVIIVVTFLLNSANSSGGLGISGAVSTAFDILIIGILYAVLIITSLVKIVRTFLKLRWEEKGISGDKLKDLNISLTAAIITAIALILIAGWFVLLAL